MEQEGESGTRGREQKRGRERKRGKRVEGMTKQREVQGHKERGEKKEERKEKGEKEDEQHGGRKNRGVTNRVLQ